MLKKYFIGNNLNKIKKTLKKTWQTLRKEMAKSNNKTSCIDEIRVGDTSYTNNHAIPNTFND